MSATHLTVIGGGPGGYAAAFLAASHGLKVTLIDRMATPGGVCLHRGCIPSKALLHVAALLGETREAEKMGLLFAEPRVNLDRMRDWKQGVVDKLTGGLAAQCQRRGVEFIQAEARFVASARLELTAPDGSVSQRDCEHVILASGSRPASIPALSLESPKVWDSTAALELESVPRRLLVIGGGYIGLELGSVYAALGSKVTVVEMTDGLLPGADRDLVRVLSKRIKESMHELRFKTRVAGLKETRAGIEALLQAEDGTEEKLVFDRVLVSVGRKPNSQGLGLEHTGVTVNARGFVEVDTQLRTADARIFAIGDLVGDPMLAHKAAHEARVAVEVICGGKARFEPLAIPAVVFTDPELAWVGLTEDQAASTGQQVTVARFPWGASGRALTLERTDGLSKLIIDPASERVLGVGLVGVNAGEMIAEATLAIEMGATVRDIAETIHAHPTLSETTMEAAEVFFGHSAHYYTPRKS